MKHLRPLTVAKASDPFAAIFFQIWLTVFSSILAGAFGTKR